MGAGQVWQEFKGHRAFNRFTDDEVSFIAGRDSSYVRAAGLMSSIAVAPRAPSRWWMGKPSPSPTIPAMASAALDGRARCDSGRVFEALPETSCRRRPPARSIAVRGYVMEVT